MDEIDVTGDGGWNSKQRLDGQNVADVVVQVVMKDCWCRGGTRKRGSEGEEYDGRREVKRNGLKEGMSLGPLPWK